MGPPLALTLGDPAGIGPEIALQAWLRREAGGVPAFGILGDPEFVRRTARDLDRAVPVSEVAPDGVRDAFAAALPVIPSGPPVRSRPGRPDTGNAAAVLGSIEAAVRLVRAGEAAAVVTNPIAKHVLYAAGFRHPGHTEYLAELAAEGGIAPRPVMMLWCEELAVVPVTVHIPLRAVPAALTFSLVLETARIVARDLASRFGIPAPRLALAGLNPHAGEEGSIGTEDRDVLAPAVAQLRAEGIDASGPFPADTLFHRQARARYDVALAAYHDQALIPIKTIAFDGAVNVTLGLPFVRTSPDHGTAFDIAGRGTARPDSLIAALRLADRLARGAAQPPG